MLLVCDLEVDDDYDYLPRALRSLLPAHTTYDYPAEGGRPPLDDVDALVFTGSTAGVYEADERPWIHDARAVAREAVDRGVPTLGVCFGHQLVNDALGGHVEHRGLTARLVDVEFDDDPLFEGVRGRIPMVHGDHVTELGDGMEPIARAEYYPYLASRHVDAPVWTVQYHPEFTGEYLPRIREDFDWKGSTDFADVTATRTVENFLRAAGVDDG